MALIRILLADDHGLLRDGLISLLKNTDELYVVAEASNGRELMSKYFEIWPEVIISDISMPGISGIEAIKKIKEKDPLVKALFLSMYDGEEYIYQVLMAGGLGLVNKSIVKSELIEAIKKVYKGERYFGNNYTDVDLSKIIKKYSSSRQTSFPEIEEPTVREIEVLRLVCEGYSSNEIASRLSLSKRTVDSHRGSLMKKLNVTTTSQLIKAAILNRIV